MNNPLIHLIFKTHLDIGFTDYAANVIQTYFEQFIPQAAALARRTRDKEMGRFRWTTGAWLIYEYLEQASPQERHMMEEAITEGDIQWHSLPFTTHTELMDESLFRFGLSYAKSLDERFGKQTIAAKMTDVPGHTRAIVPLLAEAGVRLLHIGVNPASSVPDVPPVFIWRDPASGAEIFVIYHDTYGGITAVPGLDDVLALVLTGDNHGPPAETAVEETYAALRSQMHGSSVVASTLDDFARRLDTVRDSLPVVTSEIGDSWIHGVGTDPTKVRQYRELCRLRSRWLEQSLSSADRSRLNRFSRALIMIPEHTWGMDEKTHLADHQHYTADDLKQLRKTERCRRFEESWAEQRGYIRTALDALESSPLAAEARAQLARLEPQQPDISDCDLTDDTFLRTGPLEIAFDPDTGAINRLVDQRTGFTWADSEHPLSLFTYEVFGQADYDRFWQQYIRNQHDPEVRQWAREDFTKPGLPVPNRLQWKPVINSIYRHADDRMVFELSLPQDAGQYGAPRHLFLDYRYVSDTPGTIEITLSWFDKPACRLPEAFWLSFCPPLDDQDGWHFQKLGQWLSPRDVVSRGGRTLHAIDQMIRYQDDRRVFALMSLDAPLIAPRQRSLLDYHNRLPDMRGGVHVNLYNNVWGTNFPMWFEDHAIFRFKCELV